MNMQEFVSNLILPLLEALLCALFGYLGIKLRAVYVRFTDSREKEAAARTVVGAVEQLYQDLHGEDKLNAALEHLSALLAERGITVSAKEASLLIEAAVAEFNRGFKSTDGANSPASLPSA